MESDGHGEATEQDPMKKIQEHMRKHLDWPQYFASGENVDAEDFVPAYYRVEGPNGPVSYVNPNSEPCQTTMFSFAMEAKADDFHWIPREETPWPEVESDE